jgi:hypothetical protein
MSEIVVALGLVLVIEGLLYALVPEQLKRMLVMLVEIPPDTLRMAGLAAAGAGVVVVWLAKSWLGGS